MRARPPGAVIFGGGGRGRWPVSPAGRREALRRARELNIQLQQEVFKRWFSLGPGLVAPPNGAAEQTCPHCGKTLKVKDEMAGRAGKCSDCGERTVVPAAPKPRTPMPRSAHRRCT